MLICVYQFWRGDELLYVGHTRRFDTRYAGHKAKSPWFHLVTDHSLELVEGFEAAEALELHQIRTYRPKYNIQHNLVRLTREQLDHASRYLWDKYGV